MILEQQARLLFQTWSAVSGQADHRQPAAGLSSDAPGLISCLKHSISDLLPASSSKLLEQFFNKDKTHPNTKTQTKKISLLFVTSCRNAVFFFIFLVGPSPRTRGGTKSRKAVPTAGRGVSSPDLSEASLPFMTSRF